MPRPFSVHPFDPAAMDSLLALERACFPRDAYDRNLFAKYARGGRTVFLLARGPAGALAGYSLARVCSGNPALANLISIASAPQYRGQGAASLLLSSTVRRLKLRGVRRLTLVVRERNRRARRFYARRGFAAVRRAPGYYGPGQDGILMRLNLM